MEIRKSRLNDVNQIMEVYASAKRFMIKSNNHKQWSGSYPEKSLIETDIEGNHSYVCIEEDKVIGTFFFTVGVESTYDYIEGNWLNDLPYGVIHRIAVLEAGKGIGSFMIDYCYSLIRNIKIDTHEDNMPMRNLLKKLKFKECGIIYLKTGDQRIAYQKVKE